MEERTDDVPLNPEPPLIGIIYNLKKGVDHSTPMPRQEYDSIDTVYAIRDALESGGIHPLLLEADENLPDRLRGSHIAMVFNIAEGFRGRGREAQIPALLNIFGIPFTGSDETTLCLALDKGLCKRLLATYHIRTPKYALIHPHAKPKLRGLSFPLILKPNAEGSSKGITDACVVETPAEFAAAATKNAALYGQTFLAEEYIPGREFTIGILGNGESARIFPAHGNSLPAEYAKGLPGLQLRREAGLHPLCGLPLPRRHFPRKGIGNEGSRSEGIFGVGLPGLRASGFPHGRGGAHLLYRGQPLPGLAPGYSDYPMLAEFSGMAYNELVLSILRAAALRCGIAL